MDCSTPGFPVHHQLLELAQTHVHRFSDANHLILFHPLSSCLQAFPASGSFLMSQFFTSGSQSIGASASASVPPMNIQDWLPLGLTGSPWSPRDFLSLQVFSNTTVQKHQFFSTQFSLFIYYPVKASWGQFHFFIFQTMLHLISFLRALCIQLLRVFVTAYNLRREVSRPKSTFILCFIRFCQPSLQKRGIPVMHWYMKILSAPGSSISNIAKHLYFC